MLKVIRTMFILLLMVLIISGCTNTQEHLNDTETITVNNSKPTKTSKNVIDEADAKELFREYTEAFYTIEDFTSLKYEVVNGIKKTKTVDKQYENIKHL